jgi:hypothetical protein
MSFMAIDIAGGLFSVLSLIFRDKFDVAAGVCHFTFLFPSSLCVILILR